MKIYKVTLLKAINFPVTPEFLSSPFGLFCKELNYKKWLTADEGSVGHRLMSSFCALLPDPSCVKEELTEVDFMVAFNEELATRERIENIHLRIDFEGRTNPPRLPRKKGWFRHD